MSDQVGVFKPLNWWQKTLVIALLVLLNILGFIFVSSALADGIVVVIISVVFAFCVYNWLGICLIRRGWPAWGSNPDDPPYDPPVF